MGTIWRLCRVNTVSKRQVQACILDHSVLHASCMFPSGVKDFNPVTAQFSTAVTPSVLAAPYLSFTGGKKADSSCLLGGGGVEPIPYRMRDGVLSHSASHT